MGILTAKKFLQHIDADQKLQAQVNDVAWNIDPMVAIASSKGYTVTSHDLQTAIDELWGILSEEELRNAAGGGNGHGMSLGNGDGNPALSACSFYYGH